MNNKTQNTEEHGKNSDEHSPGNGNENRGIGKRNLPGIDTSRRDFLYRVGVAALSITAAGSGAVTLDFLWPNAVKEPPVRMSIGMPADFPTNSVTLFSEPKFYVARAVEGYFYALSATCPHLGCLTKWWKDLGEIRCPCHGSRFSRTGELLAGPSPRGLYPLPMELSPRNELIVMNNPKAGLDEIDILKV